jgi:hemolysin-activating ACP:hemolysin acyltransferase
MPSWSYKFVTSERFKNGLWYAVSEDDKQMDPRLMHDYLNQVGRQGWELVTVIPVGETAMMRDQLLKHVFKKKDSKS